MKQYKYYTTMKKEKQFKQSRNVNKLKKVYKFLYNLTQS